MTSQSSPPLTRAVVDRIQRMAAGEISSEALVVARQCVLDWLGCALAGSSEPLSRILVDQVREEGAHAAASLVGYRFRVSARQAALANGAFGHALDYDDVSIAMSGHPTAAVLPAVLALAEVSRCSGDRFLRSFVAGYETAGIVGRLVAPGHYIRGFHATGTVGAIAAAAGCAVVLGLDAEASARAIGIAATQAAGLKSQFGTMCKPFHAGKASETGLLSAQLAARGFEGRSDMLECPQGFARTLSPDFDPDAAMAPSPRGFHVLDNLFKYSAACYGTHGAIEAARSLREESRADPSGISQVEVCVPEAADRMCNIVGPRTGLEGKFSLRFNVALALAGRNTSSPRSYSEETVADPVLVELQRKIDVRLMPADWPAHDTAVTLVLANGTTLARQVDMSEPEADLAVQGKRLAGKFHALADPVLGPEHAARVIEAVMALGPGADVPMLLDALAEARAVPA